MADAPPIQYARTSDGVNIAFWTYGKGPPLVLMPLLVGSHVQIDWSVPGRVAAFERLAAGATVIRYDCRGMGMSDREPIDFSPEAGIRDLQAVVDKLGVDRFAILSQHVTGEAGLLFAAMHPERVAALVHRIVLAVGPRSDALRRIQLIRPLMDEDWELYTQILGRLLAGWNAPQAGVLGSIICSSHTPASFRAVSAYTIGRPSSERLAEVRAPVLLLHALGDETEGGVARQMAAALSNCRVLAIPRIGTGSTAEGLGGPYPNEVGLTAILDFVRAPEAAKVEVRADAGLRTILWTDLVEHTRMMTRLGDEKGREVLREHERITREALRAHGGSEVKTMGDGFMASFGSVTRAVECAIALQRAFADRNSQLTTHNSQLATKRSRRSQRRRAGGGRGRLVRNDRYPGRSDRRSCGGRRDPCFGRDSPATQREGVSFQRSRRAPAQGVRGAGAGVRGEVEGMSERGCCLASAEIPRLHPAAVLPSPLARNDNAPGFEGPVRVYEVRWRE